MRQFLLTLRGNLRHDRHPDRQDCTGAVAPVARDDPSPERFDKTAANRQTEPCTRTPAVLRLDTIELVEDPLEIGWRYPRPLIDDLDLDEFPVAFGSDIDAAAGRGIFRGIVEQIEQYLLEQNRIHAQHPQPPLHLHLHPPPRNHIPPPLPSRTAHLRHPHQLQPPPPDP